ncbi:transcriptional regulator [Vibrio sp. HN007]|uniref:winged helix-turn-helix domain-containing protein n=1 Tax=Vibrio iocasae TaxID=3098914 RepID=UPI0035D5194E
MNQFGTKYILAQRFVFDPNNNSLTDQTNDNEIIRLGSNESRILLMLSERPNQIISRDQLHEFVWRDQGFQVDDSSLTQAISTLRKMLGDSTKSPAFVKTVPKRGYQFIASVAQTEQTEEASTEDEGEQIVSEVLSAQPTIQSAGTLAIEEPTTKYSSAEKEQTNLIAKLALMAAVILPLLVYLTMDPAKSRFKLLDTVEEIPLMTTEGHPPLDAWQAQIKQCATVYIKNHKGEQKPEEIIVTAGPRNNIMLNAVHSEAYSSENVTIQLVASQQDLEKLCN